MKTKLLLTLVLSFSFYLLSSQVPQGFNYQGIALDGTTPISTALPVRITIQSDAVGTTVFWYEEHASVTPNSSGLFTLVVGTGVRLAGSTVNAFSDIDWNATPKYIKTEINYGGWRTMGAAQLWTVPYSMVADQANSVASGAKLSVISNNDLGIDALFEVKRKDGQTVFAVYPDAVNIYVPRSGGKGAKGGFAIGGFDGAKGSTPQDYFRVTPDSVRVYIDPTPTLTKGAKGGFAIGGYGENKGINDMYFNLSGATSVNTVAESPQILWYPIKKAFLAGSIHIGSVDSVGQNSTALGYRSIAMGNFSQAFGYKAKAFGDYSTSIGKNSVAGSKTIPVADNAFAFGNAAKATGNDSYALGSGATASGYRSFAFGSIGLDDAGNPTTIPTTASASYTIAIGMGAQATQTGGMALGIGAVASGYYSNSFGYYSTASSYYSSALGFRSLASGYYSGAFGYLARAEGRGSLALGFYSWAVSDYSAAVGYYAKATALYAGAFGRSALAQGMSSVAVGYSATTGTSAADAGAFGKSASANGVSSIAIGNSATTVAGATDASAFGKLANASGLSSMAIGVSAKSSGNTSTAIGYNADATGDYSFAIGTYGLLANGTVNTARPTKTTLSYSMAIGMGAQSSKKGDMAIGVNSTASGEYSTALGYSPTSSGQYSTAIGYTPTSGGQYSTAFGYYANSAGVGSMALGYNSSSAGNYSASIGFGTTSVGTNATSIGYYSRANGNKSLAVGSQYNYTYYRWVLNRLTGTYTYKAYTVNKYNTADGDFSVAIGNGNQSTDGGITLGSNNTAVGSGAVAIGHTNTANSINSFVGGSNSVTTGYNAIAMGENLNAYSASSFVVGTYNTLSGSTTEWHDDDPLFVVGNGESGALHDAFVVYKNGYTRVNAVDSTYALYSHNLSQNKTSTIYGLYSFAQQANTAATGTVYGAYIYGYNQSGKGTTYGTYSRAYNNSTSTGSVYSGSFYGYNFGTGTNFGIRSYAYGSSTSGNVYSGYFTGVNYNTSPTYTYQGLYADLRSGDAIDLAEYIYDSFGDTEPADVVVADPKKKESVLKSSKPYQTSVLGVISTKPHLTMGMELVTNKDTGEPLPDVQAARLALSGRVPVNVCGENGSIIPGDYITSSSSPGHAMKWTLLDVNAAKDFNELKSILAENERRRNAIIGKAVESFSGSGTGKIIVLISLQ